MRANNQGARTEWFPISPLERCLLRRMVVMELGTGISWGNVMIPGVRCCEVLLGRIKPHPHGHAQCSCPADTWDASGRSIQEDQCEGSLPALFRPNSTELSGPWSSGTWSLQQRLLVLLVGTLSLYLTLSLLQDRTAYKNKMLRTT